MGKKARHEPVESSSDEEEYEEFDDEMMDDDMGADEGEEGTEDGEDADDGTAPAKKQKKGSQRPDREPIYDVDALHEKLEDFGWTDATPWEETLVISHDDPAQVENVDDDIARELHFYQQALKAAQQAIDKFDGSGTPWLRPQDYYAEMVKSDEHMAKVKQQLMHEQQAIEQAEERRKAREAKQYSKQVQAEKEKERKQMKKKQIQDVSKLRKQRAKTGFAGEVDYDAAFEAMDKGRPVPGAQGGFRDRGQAGAGKKGAPSKKRQARDSKYGFGGSKRLKKQNDAVSAASMSDYRRQRPGTEFGGGKGGKGFKGGKGGPGGAKKKPMKRPGKATRQAKRAGKR